ncbi:hypothetical protein F2Q69_00009359 [Brassica cretica]|uniref:Uncharacterized protein n=1 Tax=Brassica cretica TaxID=69181 RepID=A0A8S9PE80_BRACR|nr:hypothetical protein F2Q69_00009359 [Brassica cretica]
MEKRKKTMVSYVSQVLEKPGLALIFSQCACLPKTSERKIRLPRIVFEPMLEDDQTSIVVREDGSTSTASHKTEH